MNLINIVVASNGWTHTERQCPRCDDLPDDIVEWYVRNPVPDRPKVDRPPAEPLTPPPFTPPACPGCHGRQMWCFDGGWEPLCVPCLMTGRAEPADPR